MDLLSSDSMPSESQSYDIAMFDIDPNDSVEGKLQTELHHVKNFTEDQKEQLVYYYPKCLRTFNLDGTHEIIPPYSITVSNFTDITKFQKFLQTMPDKI